MKELKKEDELFINKWKNLEEILIFLLNQNILIFKSNSKISNFFIIIFNS